MKENIAEIIKKIETYDGVFPREELQILIDNQEDSTPFLLESLSDTKKLYERLEAEKDYVLPFYSLFLLAQFRETKAYPLAYEAFSFDVEKVDRLWGDLITEDLGRLLASVCGGDVSLINQLIEREDVYEYVRSSALDSWLCLLRASLKTHAEVIEYHNTLFNLPAEEDDFLRTSLIANCLDLRAEEFLPQIKRSFDENVVDLSIMGDWESFQDFWKDGNYRLFDDATNKHYDLIDDTIADLNSWHYFQSEADSEKELEELRRKMNGFGFDKDETKAERVFWESDTDGIFVRETPKVGKNEPCPCGSGRKYKKCCMNLG